MQAAGLRRITEGGNSLTNAFAEAAEAVSEELNAKYNVIRQSASEDFRPYATFMQEILVSLIDDVKSLQQRPGYENMSMDAIL